MSASFRQACVDVERAARAIPSRAEGRTEVGRLARKLESLPAGEAGKAPRDIRQVAEDIGNALRNGQPLTRRQVRQGTWCLWNPNTRLADEPALCRAILDQVGAADRPGAFRSLAFNFLDRFSPDDPSFQTAARLLVSLVDRWPGNWSRLQREFRVFDLSEGPKELARAVAAHDRSADDILLTYDVRLTQANYTKVVVAALLEHLANGGEPDHERRLEKVRKYALSTNGSPTFGDTVRQIAEAVLLPFEGARPAKTLLDKLLNLLTRALGDPRLQPARWRQVPDILTNMVRGWLAEQSLRQFLDVVGETTDNPTQWRYRRAFWEGVYDMGLISEAWVAFGTRGARLVRNRFGSEVSFGTVVQEKPRDKPVDPGHAVLILRIGDSLVTDWSHMGRCNVWSNWTSPDAPRLYEKRYRSNAVQIPGNGNTVEEDRLAVMHSNPEHYSWQRTLAKRLQSLTGRRIPEKTYLVD